MCDVIAQYHTDKTFVAREVFKLPTSDAGNQGIVLAEPEYIFDSATKIRDHLFRDLNVAAVEHFIEAMTVHCEYQGMGAESFSVGLEDLIISFHVCAIDYNSDPSGEIIGFDNFAGC